MMKRTELDATLKILERDVRSIEHVENRAAVSMHYEGIVARVILLLEINAYQNVYVIPDADPSETDECDRLFEVLSEMFEWLERRNLVFREEFGMQLEAWANNTEMDDVKADILLQLNYYIARKGILLSLQSFFHNSSRKYVKKEISQMETFINEYNGDVFSYEWVMRGSS